MKWSPKRCVVKFTDGCAGIQRIESTAGPSDQADSIRQLDLIVSEVAPRHAASIKNN